MGLIIAMASKALLIIHQGALGDFILTFPAITKLKKYYTRIDVLCQSQLGKLAKSLGLAESWYPSEAAYFASLFTDQVDPKIRSLIEQYAKIILFTMSSQLEQSINNIAEYLSCCMPPKPPAHARIHVTKFEMQNLINCGLLHEADATYDNIPEFDWKDRPPTYQKIFLHPGAGSIRKRWPVSNFLQVEAALKVAGFKPEYILGPAEKGLADELQHSDRFVHVLDDLPDLVDLLKSAGGYIGNDSGASHLAAYLGLPTTVIFGPADPERWTPIGRAVKIVRPALPCLPCFETEKTNCEVPQCLASTTPQMVIEAFYQVYLHIQRHNNYGYIFKAKNFGSDLHDL